MIAKLILLKKSDSNKNFAIRLTDNGKRSYKYVKVPFTEKEWHYDKKKRINELKGVRPGNTDKYKKFVKNRKFVNDLEKSYNDIIDDLIRLNKPFSFNKVFQLIDHPTKNPKTFFELYLHRIEELRKEKKYGNAENYKGTYNKFKKFHPKELMFNEVDDELLLKFKKQLIKEGRSKATISIHLRNIRAIYRYAIKKKVARLDEYPFTNDDIMKELKTGYKSRAITKVEVDKIRELKNKLDEGTNLWHACNYFIFGYVGRGINFQDMARLKWKDRKNGRITFIRYKTRSMVQDETSFTLTSELSKIIAWYRTNNVQLNNPYIFPILNASHKDEKTIFNRIKKMRRQVNQDLKVIGEKLGFETVLTSYTWRHTFAAIAKNDLKVGVSMISEMLGHHDLETTKHYLKQFPDEEKDKAVIGL